MAKTISPAIKVERWMVRRLMVIARLCKDKANDQSAPYRRGGGRVPAGCPTSPLRSRTTPSRATRWKSPCLAIMAACTGCMSGSCRIKMSLASLRPNVVIGPCGCRA